MPPRAPGPIPRHPARARPALAVVDDDTAPDTDAVRLEVAEWRMEVCTCRMPTLRKAREERPLATRWAVNSGTARRDERPAAPVAAGASDALRAALGEQRVHAPARRADSREGS